MRSPIDTNDRASRVYVQFCSQFHMGSQIGGALISNSLDKLDYLPRDEDGCVPLKLLEPEDLAFALWEISPVGSSDNDYCKGSPSGWSESVLTMLKDHFPPSESDYINVEWDPREEPKPPNWYFHPAVIAGDVRTKAELALYQSRLEEWKRRVPATPPRSGSSTGKGQAAALDSDHAKTKRDFDPGPAQHEIGTTASTSLSHQHHDDSHCIPPTVLGSAVNGIDISTVEGEGRNKQVDHHAITQFRQTNAMAPLTSTTSVTNGVVAPATNANLSPLWLADVKAVWDAAQASHHTKDAHKTGGGSDMIAAASSSKNVKKAREDSDEEADPMPKRTRHQHKIHDGSELPQDLSSVKHLKRDGEESDEESGPQSKQLRSQDRVDDEVVPMDPRVQLLLLEQQNRKRFMEARQALENERYSRHAAREEIVKDPSNVRLSQIPPPHAQAKQKPEPEPEPRTTHVVEVDDDPRQFKAEDYPVGTEVSAEEMRRIFPKRVW